MSTLYYIALIFCLLGISQAQNSQQCNLNIPTCQSSDNLCKSSISSFQTCVANQCDSQKISKFDIEATYNCYNTICKPTYQPLLVEIMSNFICVGAVVIDNENEGKEEQGDINLDLENNLKLFEEIPQVKCFFEMIISCKQSSDRCWANLEEQMECMKNQCNLSNESTPNDLNEINKCINNQCKSSFDFLANLNNKMIECSSNGDNSNSSQSILQGLIIILTVFILI